MKILPSLLLCVLIVSGCGIPTGRGIKEKYILPQGFKGVAVIAFASDTWRGGGLSDTRAFRIEKDGICIASNAMIRADHPNFFYEDKHGDLTSIVRHDYFSYPTYSDGSVDTTSPREVQVFGWHERNLFAEKYCNYKFIDLKICSLEELDTVDPDGAKTKALHNIIRSRLCK